jgi:hypothetical protein
MWQYAMATMANITECSFSFVWFCFICDPISICYACTVLSFVCHMVSERELQCMGFDSWQTGITVGSD